MAYAILVVLRNKMVATNQTTKINIRSDIVKIGAFLSIIGLIMSAMALVEIFFMDGEFASWWTPTSLAIVFVGLVCVFVPRLNRSKNVGVTA
jgi:uncharacterized membrane protein